MATCILEECCGKGALWLNNSGRYCPRFSRILRLWGSHDCPINYPHRLGLTEKPVWYQTCCWRRHRSQASVGCKNIFLFWKHRTFLITLIQCPERNATMTNGQHAVRAKLRTLQQWKQATEAHIHTWANNIFESRNRQRFGFGFTGLALSKPNRFRNWFVPKQFGSSWAVSNWAQTG